TRIFFLYLKQDIPTRYFWKTDVEQHNIDYILAAPINVERCFPIGCRQDLIPLLHQVFSKRSSMFFSSSTKRIVPCTSGRSVASTLVSAVSSVAGFSKD